MTQFPHVDKSLQEWIAAYDARYESVEKDSSSSDNCSPEQIEQRVSNLTTDILEDCERWQRDLHEVRLDLEHDPEVRIRSRSHEWLPTLEPKIEAVRNFGYEIEARIHRLTLEDARNLYSDYMQHSP